MTIGSEKAWLGFIWTVGLSFACYNFIHEFYEFQKVKQAASDNLTTSMEAFSVISQKKSRSLLQRMEVNNKLLAKHPDLVQLITQGNQIGEDQLDQFQKTLAISKSRITVITDQEGQILYAPTHYLDLLQSTSIADKQLFIRTQKESFAWDIYFQITEDHPKILSSTLVLDEQQKPIGQVIIENDVQWIPLLQIEKTKLLIVNDYYQVGFYYESEDYKKVRLSPQRTHLFNEGRSQPLTRLEGFKEDTLLTIEEQQEFGIDYYLVDGAFSGNALMSSAYLSEGWSIVFLVPIGGALDQLNDEIFELIQHMLVILLICCVLHRFIVYHFRIVSLTFTDELTGLHNRQHYKEFIPPLTKLHDRDKISHFGLLVIDIDHFKSVNDTYGHPIGDLVLKELATHLHATCRETDHIYRFGGEEFLIITEGDDLEQLIAFANRLRESVTDIKEIKKKIPDGITISVGVALRNKEEDLKDLFKRTDDLLYAAKQNGRNRVEF